MDALRHASASVADVRKLRAIPIHGAELRRAEGAFTCRSIPW
jgi:hypothetical protein